MTSVLLTGTESVSSLGDRSGNGTSCKRGGHNNQIKITKGKGTGGWEA